MQQTFRFNLQQERDFSEKLNGAFTFVSQNFKPLLLLLVRTALPLAIIGGIAQGIYQSGLFSKLNAIQTNPENINKIFGNTTFDIYSSIFSTAYLISVVFILITMAMVQTVVYSYMKVYSEGNEIDEIPDKVLQIVKSKFLNVFLADIVIGILTIIALFFLVIPGIYLGIVFSMVLPVMIIEEQSLSNAMSRCFVLIKDKWWSTLGIILIAALISYMMSMIFTIPEMGLTIFHSLNLVPGDFKWLHILTAVVAAAGQYLLYSFIAIATGIQYFNLQERADGKGLRAQIDSIGLEFKTNSVNTGDF